MSCKPILISVPRRARSTNKLNTSVVKNILSIYQMPRTALQFLSIKVRKTTIGLNLNGRSTTLSLLFIDSKDFVS